MICDICHTREARIFYTEIINGEKKEQHLCEECAAEYTTYSLKDKLGNEIPLGNILSGIMSNYAKSIAAKQVKETVCSRCGLTSSELLKNGKLGCPECYTAFRSLIDKNLQSVQGASEHKGKVPFNAVHIESSAAGATIAEAEAQAVRKPRKPRKSAEAPAEGPKTGRGPSAESAGPDIRELKKQLTTAIAAEDYEEAARLRDLIHSLDGGQKGKKDGTKA